MTKDEFLNSIKEYVGEDTSDKAISFIETMDKAFDESNAESNESWEKKYNDLNESWAKKYKARFFSGDSKESDSDNTDTDSEIEKRDKRNSSISFNDLFK